MINTQINIAISRDKRLQVYQSKISSNISKSKTDTEIIKNLRKLDKILMFRKTLRKEILNKYDFDLDNNQDS